MDYSKMSWTDLMQARREAAKDQALQDLIAPYEHRAYARETVADQPWMAPFFPPMIAGYQALKLAKGGAGARTKPSWAQVGQGLLGTLEGLQQGLLGD
jgi:hypothetical protein